MQLLHAFKRLVSSRIFAVVYFYVMVVQETQNVLSFSFPLRIRCFVRHGENPCRVHAVFCTKFLGFCLVNLLYRPQFKLA